MRNATRKMMMAVIAILLMLPSIRPVLADDAPETVKLKYAKGDTEFDTLKTGVKAFTNRNYKFGKIPAELVGLMFTCRQILTRQDLEMDVPAGTQVYLILNADGKGSAEDIDKSLTDSGWNRLTDIYCEIDIDRRIKLALYKQTFASHQQLKLSKPIGQAFSGFIIAAKDLALNSDDSSGDKKPETPAEKSTLHTDPKPDAFPISGPATRPAMPQASIKSLEIYETDSGMMLGQTSEMVLTINRGDSPRQTAVRYVTRVGNEMSLARDEAVRFIRITYPNWYVDNAELTFEDKYVAHDGGSNGAAVGTMVLSVIQGFQIDPDVAITGDISANGKIRAIGGIAAKLRGAIADKCILAAVPNANEEQLQDAVIYNGPSLLTDIQVIGINNLADAIATVRIDRDPKLTQAIALFATLQQSAKDLPSKWATEDAQKKLAAVLALAPQHLSAQILLEIAQGKLPKTLTATASRYYTALAIHPMLEELKDRSESKQPHELPSGVIRTGLTDLRKLRPLADPNVRPLIDAWFRFIESWNAFQQGSGSTDSLETQRQLLLDEMAKENADAELLQKMLKEGF